MTAPAGRREAAGVLGGNGPRMGFVGVSTAASSIMRIFPRWAAELGLPTRQLQGHDVALDAPPATYRVLVEAMRDDPDYLGALVTSHKISVHAAAADLFDEVDPFAELCGEISSISHRDGRLLGHAKDPLTADLAMAEFLPAGHFAAGAPVLCLGSGGAGAAITWCLAQRPDVPARIVCTDVDPARLRHLAEVHRRGGLSADLFDYQLLDGPADALLAGLGEGALLVNATGLGKDRPGSPLSPDVRLPPGSVFWELNYRGALPLLARAREQQDGSGLTVVDGWRYFIHGWTQVIAEVFDVEMTPDRVQRLSDLAAEA